MTLDLETAFAHLLNGHHGEFCSGALDECRDCEEYFAILKVLQGPPLGALCDGCMHYHEPADEVAAMDLYTTSASIAQLCPTCKTFTDWAKKSIAIIKDFIDAGFCVHCGSGNEDHTDLFQCPVARHVAQGEDQYGAEK
jgi:hypothetical protein